MSNIGLSRKLSGLATATVFGSLGLLILTRMVLHWTQDDADTAILLYVVLLCFLVVLGEMRLITNSLGGFGEAMGYFFMATVAGGMNAWANTRGEPTKDVKDQLKEKVVRATLKAADSVPEHEPLVNVMKLNMTLDAMALRAADGQPISRDAMVSADITTQQYWNLANHILKLQGLRKDKTTKWFGCGDSRQDIHFIQRNLRVIDDVVLVREGGRNGWKRVDLVESNFIVP